MLKGVIFDLDGVLVNSEPVAFLATKKAFAQAGVKIEKRDVVPFIGAGGERYVFGLAEKFHVNDKKDEILQKREEYYLGMTDKVQGWDTRQSLEKLRKAGLKLALATSARRERMEILLKTVDMTPLFFDATVTGDEAVHKKPDPEIFLKALHKMKLKMDECVIVEDSVNGVQAAKRAGVKCIAVLTSFKKSDLKMAHHICGDVRDAVDYILKHKDSL